MANQAVRVTRRIMPKMTGQSSSRISPAYGKGYFGVKFQDSYVWFQENGIRAFTMYSLAGKTIPMWISDPTGTERAKNPKAKTRVTANGTTQVLIFRRAARLGQTKRVKVAKTNTKRGLHRGDWKIVPASYPGAPGRIARTKTRMVDLNPGVGFQSTGQIASGNVGVRWRHPGLQPRLFLNFAMTETALRNGYWPDKIYACDQSNWRNVVKDARRAVPSVSR